MATNDSSNPAGQAAPELVEILRQLGAHRRAVHEQTYGNPPWTHEQSAAYWHHPLVWACKWLEQRLAIDRHDLENAAFRLTTPLGLRGMDPLTGPGGGTTDVGQPDLLWMIPKFRELDRDGTTTRLWELLAEKYPAILEEAGVPTETCDDSGQPPAAELDGDATRPTKAKRSTERGEGRAKLIAALTRHHKYDDRSCLNLEAIGNNELARLAGVSESTASSFFDKQFGGHAKYRAKCRDARTLADALKAVRGEFTPAELSQMTLDAFEAGKRLADED